MILGAGFAGLRAALGLGRSPNASVTLVDRSAAPAIKTRLHELRRRVSRIPVRSLLRGSRVRFVQGEISRIDRRRRFVQAGTERLAYDWLVIALGSRTSDLGVRGARRHALFLDSSLDAVEFVRLVERVKRRKGPLVVVGAGPTGVEAAAEAAQRLGRGRVVLLEAGPRILPQFGRLAALYVSQRLLWLGVCVRTGAKVSAIERRRIVLAGSEEILADAVVWTAGIEPSPVLAATRLAPAGHAAAVDRYLVSKVDPKVYVIGDCATSPGSGRPSAQTAVQQGDFVADDLRRRISRERREPYRGMVLGEFLSLGALDAAGKIRLGPLEIPVFGPPAWVIKQAGVLRHQLTVARSGRALPRTPARRLAK